MLAVGVAAAFLIFGASLLVLRSVSERSPRAAAGQAAAATVQTGAIAAPATPASEGLSVTPVAQSGEPAITKTVSTPASAEAAKSRAADNSPPRPSARLVLAVSPWGEIYVDGRKRGTSPPLTELRLAPGQHTIEIRNASFTAYSDTVNLEANAYVKIKHRFR